MNTKLRELAEQAGLYDFVIEAMGIDSEMQQFAELIVKECVDVCLEQHHIWKWDDEPGSDSGPRNCARSINEHFGVEE